MTLLDSYSSNYQLAYAIQPFLNFNCPTQGGYGIINGVVEGGPSAFTFNTTTRQILVTDWGQLQNNAFYKLMFTITLFDISKSSFIPLQGEFYFVVGQVNINYSPQGNQFYRYGSMITLDYTSAFDPAYPKAAITVAWQCNNAFKSCSSLRKSVSINAFTAVLTYGLVFGYNYNFNVTLSNPTTRNTLAQIDRPSFTINPPEMNFNPQACVEYTLNIKSTQNVQVLMISKNEMQIIFDNKNYTDVSIDAPIINLGSCIVQFGALTQGFTFFSENNPGLFDYVQSYQITSSDLVLTRTKIASGFAQRQVQSLSWYTYIFNSATKQILAYDMMRLSLRLNDQTLFARVSSSFVQVDRDKVLYIDASKSMDTRYNLVGAAANIDYNWNIEGFSSIQFQSQRILTLTPDIRNQRGINQAGKYYIFYLTVSDQTRISEQIRIVVQITPESDPNSCITVQLKDIDVEKIITYTIWPLILQTRVIQKSCSGLVKGALVWECTDIGWPFWQNFGNNNTIAMDRDDLKRLPKSKDIYMQVTQYYQVNSIEYISRLKFVLFVERADLVPIVKYPQVYNPRDGDLLIDASGSQDPQAVSAGTADIPITCKWECPSAFLEICNNPSFRTSNGCILLIPNNAILTYSNYQFSIAGQMHLFTLTLSKDSRSAKTYIYVSVIDNNNYPRCTIVPNKTASINQPQYIYANCITSNPSRFTFLWSIYDWHNQMQYIQDARKLVLNNGYIRLPPYLFSPYEEILITVMVTDGQYSTPIGFYMQINEQSFFNQGTINVNFNQFTAYISNFIMTPNNWDSSISQFLNYQYRIKESDSPIPQYRVLLAPQDVSTTKSIQTILPPLTYEKVVYIDVLDTLGNFLTIKMPIISNLDTFLTPTVFALRINNIIQSVPTQFREDEFEQNIYKLKLLFQAYAQEQILIQEFPSVFFRILGENTIQYLYNILVIDKRINYVEQFDRKSIIRQHIIEILSFIVSKHPSPDLNSTMVPLALTLTNNMLQGGNFSLGNTLVDTCLKAYSIAFLTMSGTYQALHDQIVLRVQQTLNSYMLLGEKLSYQSNGWEFQASKVNQVQDTLPDLSNFQYNKGSIIGRTTNGGMVFMIRNSTFVSVQINDKFLNPTTITSINPPASITFTLSSEWLSKYLGGTASFFCASRESFQQSWSVNMITMNSVDNSTGQVVCSATHFSQYTLFLVNKAPTVPIPSGGGTTTPNITNNTTTPEIIDPSRITNQTTQDKVIDGKWNSTLANYTIMFTPEREPFIYEEKSVLMYLVSLGVLVFFLIQNLTIRLKYKGEYSSYSRPQQPRNFSYDQDHSLQKNRCRLFWQLLLHFNPYLNLFLIFNKFLPRWLRSLLLQNYFMVISLAFGINQTLLSVDISQLSQAKLVGLFLIIMIGTILLRPWSIKLFYKLLYEPDSRVEDYKVTTQQHQMGSETNMDNAKVVDFEINEDDKQYSRNQSIGGSPAPLYDLSAQMPQSQISKISIKSQQLDRENTSFANLDNNDKRDTDMNNMINPNDSEEYKIQEYLNPQSRLGMNEQQNFSLNQSRNLIPKALDRNETGRMFPTLFDQNPIHQNRYNANDFNDMAKAFDECLDPIQERPALILEEGPLNRSEIEENKDSKTQDQISKDSMSLRLFDSRFFQEQEMDKYRYADNRETHQFEGGEQEGVGQMDITSHVEDLPRIDSLEEQAHTHHAANLREDQRTEFENDIQFNPQGKRRQNSKRLEESIIQNKKSRPQSDDSLMNFSNSLNTQQNELMTPNKTLFITKIFGKLILLVFWTGLIILNFLCLLKMRTTEFKQWAILSSVTFATIQLIIDPILYWFLTLIMIKSQDAENQHQQIRYYTKRGFEKSFSQVFVIMFIGREKMKDLKRRLNPINPQ